MKHLLLAACFGLAACAGGAMRELVLPMPVPPVVDREVLKGEPMRIGTAVVVPAADGRVEMSRLAWEDGRAQLIVRWADARGLHLHLRADGDWDTRTRVSVQDLDGRPAHADTWAPAERAEWWSPAVSGDAIVIEVEHPPGDAAALIIVSATTGNRE